ncbi:unnamed protein product [Tuber melanosporum]|uniref:(Perigord truffle) hypothetical protein n=1 Tax=Tuber melanosporum (strain Mel28) TaxID=656061 RepID=D5GPK2_TUBMM|nr:uncharacterized protein GSTUM_00011882001 [Tuber melanosporum]CAZ86445.1 unnamed protein product [Tuber melanosporum]
MGPRGALLLVGLQNEFLDPHMGRCLMTPPEPGKPSFVDNIKNFLPHFRARGGDVIWVRSEYRKPRDCEDPRNDEVVLLVDDEGYYVDEEEQEPLPEANTQEGARRKGKSATTLKHDGQLSPSTAKRSNTTAEENYVGPPQLHTDAFLAIESDNPPCAPSSIESEFYPPLLPVIQTPPDRVLIKTWFSAFKDTKLLETLRGRFITELYLCGTIANACILATAADAAKHGLEVTILTDCVGYRSEMARDRAMRVMIDDFAVEEVRSTLLAKSWEKTRNKSKGATGPAHAGVSGKVEKLLEVDTESSGYERGDYDYERTSELGELRLDSLSLKDGDAPQPPDSGESAGAAVEGGAESPVPTSPSPTSAKPQSPIQDKNPIERAPATREPVLRKPRMASRNKKFQSKAPVLGQGDVLGEGDSEVVNNILPADLADVAFERLKKEVAWRSMYHRGGEVPRLVAVEGEISDDGSFPIYRHPADESPPLLPFSDTVGLIREYVQRVLKQPVNHVLIQHYRDGNDYISEHSDKTLDIAKGSKIVNVSLGAQRVMILRTKKDQGKPDESSGAETNPDKCKTKESAPQSSQRPTQRIPLPHNSMFVLGLESNKKWLHGIKQDKRAEFLKTPKELSYNGERISLTFRQIATFLSSDEKTIYGQGATSKSEHEPREVINGEGPEAEKLLEAFGSENHQSDFDWDTYYGAGSDVLHLKEQVPKLFFVRNDPGGLRVKICLHEKGIRFVDHELKITEAQDETQTPSFLTLSPHGHTPVFIDIDKEKTTVCESLAIIQYLEMFYPSKEDKWLLPSLTDERAAFARVLQRMQESEQLATVLKHSHDEGAVEREFAIWEEYLSKAGGQIAGDEFSLADIAAFPVIDQFVKRTGYKIAKWREIEAWLTNMGYRESVRATR